jgi:hypothetical protein
MVERGGAAAGLDFKAHSHMVRHACGYLVANRGHEPDCCKPTSAEKTFSTPPATPSCRRPDSRISGGNNLRQPMRLSHGTTLRDVPWDKGGRSVRMPGCCGMLFLKRLVLIRQIIPRVERTRLAFDGTAVGVHANASTVFK